MRPWSLPGTNRLRFALHGGQRKTTTNTAYIQGTGLFDNAGTLSVKDGTLYLYSQFSNTGLVDVQSGSLRLSGEFTQRGTVDIAKSASLYRSGDYVQTGGSTHIDGTLTATSGIDILGGTLTGSGTVNGDLFNSGLLFPEDSYNSLAVTGDFTQNYFGILDIGIGGLLQGTNYDFLDVWGTADLGGTLNVSIFAGYTPTLGDTFNILTASALNGSTFDFLNFATFNGMTFDIAYGTDYVRLTTIANSVPEPPAVWLIGFGLLGLIALGKRQKLQSLQMRLYRLD